MGAQMKTIFGLLAAAFAFAVPATADECRRVTTPTVVAVVAHGGVWTRKVEQGKTFTVKDCGTQMFGKIYCRIRTAENPPVYLQHTDQSGYEHTVVWGKNCR
jgi:hypothetical protein